MIAAVPAQYVSESPVVRVYEDACAHGQLVLNRSIGEVVSFSKLPPPVRRLINYDRKTHVASATYVRMKSPPSTYVAVRHLNVEKRGMTTGSCKVISSQISREDAVMAMSNDMGAIAINRRFDWGEHLPIWTADNPIKGVRRTVYDDRSGWIVMTTEVYRPHNQASVPE